MDRKFKTHTFNNKKDNYKYTNTINCSDSEDSDEEEMITTKGNKVYFHSPINRNTCLKLIQSLQKAQEFIAIENIKNEFQDNEKVYLYIFSDGGELHAAFNVADYILSSKIDIITICEGCVASAGTVISLAGTERYIRKNAYMLIHEIRSGCLGKYSECQDDMENNDILMEHVKEYMNDRCKNKKLKKKLSKVLKHDKIWNADKCLRYGLVDKIV